MFLHGSIAACKFGHTASIFVKRCDWTFQSDIAAKAAPNNCDRTIQRATHNPAALVRRVGKRWPIDRQAITLVAVSARVNVVAMSVRMRVDEYERTPHIVECRDFLNWLSRRRNPGQDNCC